MIQGKVLVAGGSGMVGSAIVRQLVEMGIESVLTPTHKELDLLEQGAVRAYLKGNKPDLVIIAAAKVGGIHANATYPAEFIYQNLMIQTNLIHESHCVGVDKLLFLGSTCIYPKYSPQPIPETALLTGGLEPTNEAYAVAKISGLKMCNHYRKQYGRCYFSVMPTNLYGRGDNYHPENSHVIPGLIRRFHEAKQEGAESVKIWGTGAPLREFLFVDDLADACCFLLQRENPPSVVNVGSQEEMSIRALGEMIAEVVGFTGVIEQDPSKPDGTPRKKSDTGLLTRLGWKASTSLREGLELVYEDFLQLDREVWQVDPSVINN